jgi:uncharacterized protein (TIGR02246 family)
MGADTPSHINARFAEGFNQRDVDGLLALYDADGCVVELDGSVAAGADAVRSHLSRLVAIGGEMISTNRSAVLVGDTALVTAEWQIALDDGAGDIRGRSAEVLRQQADGSWCYLIDQPLAE